MKMAAPNKNGPLWATACHEAGHAVAAHAVGWGLREAGITIDTHSGGNTSVQPDAKNWSPWAYCFVALAGPASEPGVQVRTDARRLESVRAARRWLIDDECDGHSVDALQTAGMLITVTPTASDNDIVADLKRREIETWALVQETAFRTRVETVATALLDHLAVSPDEFALMMK
jgi:hypothetical protein